MGYLVGNIVAHVMKKVNEHRDCGQIGTVPVSEWFARYMGTRYLKRGKVVVGLTLLVESCVPAQAGSWVTPG